MILTITNLTAGLVNIRKPFCALAANGTHTVSGVQFSDVIANPELLDLIGHSTISVAFASDPADQSTLSVLDVSTEISSRIAGATIAAKTAIALDSSGHVIEADSTDGTKRAIGVSIAGAASSALCTFVTRGVAAGVLTAATPGAIYYLSTVGTLTTTPPAGSGNLDQIIGFANSATDLYVRMDNGTLHA